MGSHLEFQQAQDSGAHVRSLVTRLACGKGFQEEVHQLEGCSVSSGRPVANMDFLQVSSQVVDTIEVILEDMNRFLKLLGVVGVDMGSSTLEMPGAFHREAWQGAVIHEVMELHLDHYSLSADCWNEQAWGIWMALETEMDQATERAWETPLVWEI